MSDLLPYLYIISLHVAAPLSVVLAAIAWRQRREWAVPALPPLLTLGCAWTATLLLGAWAPDAERAHFWIYQARMAVIAFGPATVLLVVLEITGRSDRLRGPWLAALFAVPVATQFILFSDAAVWFMEPAEVRRVAGFWTLSRYTRGPWMGVHLIYAYTCSLLALALITLEIGRNRALFRRRAVILVAGLLIASLSAVPNLHGLLPPPHFDWTVLGLCAQSVLWTWALARNPSTFDFMPIARDAVLELIDDAILAVDHRRRVIDANRAARQLFAHVGDLTGTPLARVVGRDGTPLTRQLTLAETPQEVSLDGRVYEARSKHLQPLPGHKAGRVIVLHDITTHKQLVDDLDSFARAVAHDLRNPIGVIVGYAEMAADEAGASPLAREAYATVVDRAREMAERIDALLLLARVGGGAAVDLETVDMGDALRRGLADVAPLVDASGAAVEVAGPLPPARGYAPWIVAVLANYLSNAVKYGGKPPRVAVGADDAGAFVRYWVRDNGAGMTPPQQAAIFREFARLGDAGVAGHGLGLSIVRRIVDRLGGQVGVRSSPGGGSTFWFTLPRAAG